MPVQGCVPSARNPGAHNFYFSHLGSDCSSRSEFSQYTIQGLPQNLPSDEVDVWRLCGAEDPDSTSPLEVVVNWSSGGCSITSSNRGSEWRDGVDWLSLHSCEGWCCQGGLRGEGGRGLMSSRGGESREETIKERER